MISLEMDNRPIAFLDSGVGGLPYLSWVRERLADERFIYVADNANFPYGVKSQDELRAVVVSVIGKTIARFAPKLIVIACNTASVVALDALRSIYSVPFVGVVPAVKPAAEHSRARKIALLATTRTVGDAYSERLIQEYASDCTVVRIAGQQLVSFVENEYLDANPARLKGALEATVAPLRPEKVDSLILGCTHFTFLDREFKAELGESVEIVDSRAGVGRQVSRLLSDLDLEASPRTDGHLPPESTLFHTAHDNGRYARYADFLKIAYGGVLT